MALRPRPETHCCCGARGKVAVKWNDDRQRLIWLARIDAEAELLISTTNNQMPAMLIDVFGDLRSETWDVNGRRDAKACRSRREEDDGGEHLWLPEERSAPNARQGARVLFPRPLRRRRPLEQWCCSLLDRRDSDAGTPTRTRVDRGPSGSLVVLMNASRRLVASLVSARCTTRKGCPPSPPNRFPWIGSLRRRP